MAGDDLTEKEFVFEFDTCHVEQVVQTFVHFEFFSENCRVFVFDGVFAFEPTCKIHRHKPTRNVTTQPERPADRPENFIAHCARFCIELFEPFSDSEPMLPFLSLDLSYSLFFWRFAKRFPMPAVRIRGRNLAGIRVLKNANEFLPRCVQLTKNCIRNAVAITQPANTDDLTGQSGSPKYNVWP